MKKERIIEFLIIGVVFGTVEDLLAVLLATEASFTLDIFIIVLAVSIPFAFISEVIVDHPKFWKSLLPKNIYNRIKKNK